MCCSIEAAGQYLALGEANGSDSSKISNRCSKFNSNKFRYKHVAVVAIPPHFALFTVEYVS